MPRRKIIFALFFAFIVTATLSFGYKEILASGNSKIEASKIFFIIGKHYFERNSYESAVKYFGKSIELNPDFAEAHHNLGISHYFNKNTADAINSLKKSIELNDDYAKAHYSIALAYYHANDFGNAIAHFSRAVQLEPENANAHFDLAVAYVARFREKESSGNIAYSDIEGLREGEKHYLQAENLKHGFPYALSNAEIVKSAIEEYGIKFG